MVGNSPGAPEKGPKIFEKPFLKKYRKVCVLRSVRGEEVPPWRLVEVIAQ